MPHRYPHAPNHRCPQKSGDAWSIHEGSCLYYYLDANIKTGWDVAALSVANADFGGSCVSA